MVTDLAKQVNSFLFTSINIYDNVYRKNERLFLKFSPYRNLTLASDKESYVIFIEC